MSFKNLCAVALAARASLSVKARAIVSLQRLFGVVYCYRNIKSASTSYWACNLYAPGTRATFLHNNVLFNDT